MANNNRSRFCLLAGTAFILLAASSRANPQGEALHVRPTPEEEQQQEIFEEDLIEVATHPPSSKDFSTQVWEGVIKQEANALEPSPSLDIDGDITATVPAKKKNKKKKNRRKKGMRKETPKGGARKGGRRRHRRQKKHKKAPIEDRGGDAQSGPMPQSPVSLLIPDPDTIPAPIPVPPSETPKPVKDRDAADKMDKDKAKVDPVPPTPPVAPVPSTPPVAPVPIAVPAPIVSVAAKVDKAVKEGVKPIRDATKSAAVALPTITAAIQDVVTGVEDAVKSSIPLIPVIPIAAVPDPAPAPSVTAVETKTKDSGEGAEGIIKSAAPAITAPTAVVPVQTAVSGEPVKTIKDVVKSIEDTVKSALPAVQIPTITPDVAASIQAAIPIPNAIDDLFASATPTLGFVAPTTTVDKPEGAPMPVAGRPVATKAPLNHGEPSSLKHPSPTDDDEVDPEDNKNKNKDNPTEDPKEDPTEDPKEDSEEDDTAEEENHDDLSKGNKALAPEEEEPNDKDSEESPQIGDRVDLDEDGNLVSTDHQEYKQDEPKSEEESDEANMSEKENHADKKDSDDDEDSQDDKASKKANKKQNKLHQTTKAHRRPFSTLREMLLKLEMEEAAALIDSANMDVTGGDIPQENPQLIDDYQASVASSADQDVSLSALRHPPTPEEIKDTEHQGADAFFELLAPEIVSDRKVAQADQEKGEEDKGAAETKKEKKQSKKDKEKKVSKDKKVKKGEQDKKAQKKDKKNNDKNSKKQEKDKNEALEKRQIPAAPAPPIAAAGVASAVPIAAPQHPLDALEVHVDDKKEAKDAIVDAKKAAVKVKDAAVDIKDVVDSEDATIDGKDKKIVDVKDYKEVPDANQEEDAGPAEFTIQAEGLHKKHKNKGKQGDSDFVDQEGMVTNDDLDDDIVPAALENDNDAFFIGDVDAFFIGDVDDAKEIGVLGGKKHKKGKKGEPGEIMGAMDDTKDDKNEGMKHKGKKDKEQEIQETKPKDNNDNKPAQPQQGSTPKGGGPPDRSAPAAHAGAVPAAGGGNGGAAGYGTVPMFGPAQLDLSNAAGSIRGSAIKSMFVAVAAVMFVLK
ncbi:hypothetical protein BG005_008612 [Podila minutissima]|nr:hypothetical protein BG005_008612 [Podila minutissima]